MRILGVDLGTFSLKAVEIDSAFGRYEVHDYHEQKVEAGEEPVAAFQRLIHSLPKKPDRVVMALPTRDVTFRNLHLPTRDRKAIQAGVGFELEDELPFPAEKSIYDYSILSQTKQSSELHVAATLRSRLVSHLEKWQLAGADPDIITTEAWAYRNYLNRVLSPADSVEPVLLIDIGHSRTVLYLHWKGAPILAREIPWGGQDLSEAIAQKYRLGPEQAETAKIDHGFVVPPSQKEGLTPEQADFSETLLQPMRALLQELRQTEFTCKNVTHHNVRQIYVGGGTTLLPGLVRVLEESLFIPVRPIQALSSISSSGVAYSEHTDGVFLLATSLALSLAGSDRSALINFRKNSFSKQGVAREFSVEQMRRPLLATGAVIASLLVSLTIESRIYRSRLSELDVHLERSLKSFFGSLSSSAVRTYLTNTSTLRNSIQKELTKQRELSRITGPNPRSPVDFLKSLSTAVPRDVVVDMTQFQVGASPTAPFAQATDQTASLTFIVANPQVAEKLTPIVNGVMKDAKREKMEEVAFPEPNQKRWKIVFTGKPNEDAYGK